MAKVEPRQLTVIEIAATKRLHNSPENAELGPCQCPVCRIDLQPESNAGEVMAALLDAAENPKPAKLLYYDAFYGKKVKENGPTPEDVAKAIEEYGNNPQTPTLDF